jgi:hypothetical protein
MERIVTVHLLRDPATGDLVRQPPDAPGYDGWQDLGPAPDTPAGADAFDAQAGAAICDVEVLWAALRAERVERLRACDWAALPDVPEPTRLAWLTYRQALRDIPEITLDPVAPIWPTPPE